jgi:hypothetical protein
LACLCIEENDATQVYTGVIIKAGNGPGCFMKSRCLPVLFLPMIVLSMIAAFCVVASVAVAQTSSASPPAHISKQTREDLIRAFTSELVYIRASFPMGRKGLTLKDGVVSPNGDDLQHLLAMWGPATKPGDRALISNIVIKNDRILFEINGGPVKKQKWYQHIQVAGVGGGGDTPIAPSESNANPRGSCVDLVFDHYVPDLGPKELKNLLRPVFDFDSKSPLQAYLETVPPKVKQAIEDHQVLVGMNREMVIYSKGRPPKKVRENDGDTAYEEWIYGDPPKDVDFVRLVGDEVVRVETMKVDGQKVLRTDKEVNLEQPSVASGASQPQERPANAPSLRRPGEAPPVDPQRDPGSSKPMTPPPAPPSGSPTPPNYAGDRPSAS